MAPRPQRLGRPLVRELNSIGIAAFTLDCFSGRGITSTISDQGQLNSLAMVLDAYSALDMLAAHPGIQADRIAVMGFSKARSRRSTRRWTASARATATLPTSLRPI